jgi:hypothetical protein
MKPSQGLTELAEASGTLRRLRNDSTRLFQWLLRIRSLMLVVLAVAMIVWGGVLGWRRAELLSIARYFREQASRYAEAEALHADAIANVTNVELEIAVAEPPSARADGGAWRAYRDYLSDLETKVRVARASLDEYEKYRALHRDAKRLAAYYERADMRPWVGTLAKAPDGQNRR